MKKSNVYAFKPTASWESYYKKIGELNQTQLNELISRLNDTEIHTDSCISKIEYQLILKRHLTEDDATPVTDAIDLPDVKITDFYYNLKFQCNDTGNKPTNNFTRIKYCMNNFMAGKCRCNYMRNVLGAVLFPEIYAKTK